MDTLQRAVESRERLKATEASQETGTVVNKLVEHLEKVREALEKVQEALELRISPQSSSSSCSSGEDNCKPPVQETCDDPAQTLATIMKTSHKDKQQGIPMGDWQRKPTRWTKPTEYHSSGCSQSAPCSPELGRDSSGRRKQRVKTAVQPQTTTKKPMIPPAMRHLPPKTSTKTPVEDYGTLSPDIDDDTPTTSGTGDSGYGGREEWKQHMHHPPPAVKVNNKLGTFQDIHADSEGHYYKSLHKDEIIEDAVYDEVQQ